MENGKELFIIIILPYRLKAKIATALNHNREHTFSAARLNLPFI